MDGYNTAGALMMFMIHLLVIQTLMRNPEEYAEKNDEVFNKPSLQK